MGPSGPSAPLPQESGLPSQLISLHSDLTPKGQETPGEDPTLDMWERGLEYNQHPLLGRAGQGWAHGPCCALEAQADTLLQALRRETGRALQELWIPPPVIAHVLMCTHTHMHTHICRSVLDFVHGAESSLDQLPLLQEAPQSQEKASVSGSLAPVASRCWGGGKDSSSRPGQPLALSSSRLKQWNPASSRGEESVRKCWGQGWATQSPSSSPQEPLEDPTCCVSSISVRTCFSENLS